MDKLNKLFFTRSLENHIIPMKKKISIYLSLLLISFFAYTQKRATKIIEYFSQENGEITIDVQCVDEDRKKYLITWEYDIEWLKNNTYHTKSDYPVLTCVVYGAGKKVLHVEKGENKGRSFCIITSRKNVVSLVFAIRKGKAYPPEYAYYDRQRSCNVGEFLPIKVNVDKTSNVDRHAMPKRRKHYTFPLINNGNIALLTYYNKGAMYPFDNMPSTNACHFHIAINPTRYYLSLKNGKIRKGKHWLSFNSIKQLVEILQLVEMEEMATYQNKKGETFSGEQLIKAKKVALDSFDFRETYR